MCIRMHASAATVSALVWLLGHAPPHFISISYMANYNLTGFALFTECQESSGTDYQLNARFKPGQVYRPSQF